MRLSLLFEGRLHDLLEIPTDADEEEIKRAFRKKAIKHHPDKGGDIKKYIELQKAKDQLLSGIVPDEPKSDREPEEFVERFGSAQIYVKIDQEYSTVVEFKPLHSASDIPWNDLAYAAKAAKLKVEHFGYDFPDFWHPEAVYYYLIVANLNIDNWVSIAKEKPSAVFDAVKKRLSLIHHAQDNSILSSRQFIDQILPIFERNIDPYYLVWLLHQWPPYDNVIKSMYSSIKSDPSLLLREKGITKVLTKFPLHILLTLFDETPYDTAKEKIAFAISRKDEISELDDVENIVKKLQKRFVLPILEKLNISSSAWKDIINTIYDRLKFKEDIYDYIKAIKENPNIDDNMKSRIGFALGQKDPEKSVNAFQSL